MDNRYYEGKSFTVIAHDNSSQNINIQKARLNGRPLSEPHIDFSDIASRGTLELWMGSEPSEFFQ
ncbi:MAG: glycoside hydrolase domain-containing protein [Candidatus Cryptobacteroides sp.]|nr:glycoside hydrolase domain-containing protein [Candidatus Cryptobacteroides sp.]MEE3430984.1 glycoside hydrolase domain-containing protein [Candidatus Cryptobacteroides sp.]